MKKFLVALLCQALFIVGCSKQSAVTQGGPDETPAEEVANPVAQQSVTTVSNAITGIQADLQAQRFDDVAVKLAVLNGVPKTPELEREYKKAVYETEEALRQQAQTNSVARERYQNFGRMMMGR